MMINPLATGGLYLLMNLPAGVVAARITRRPLLASALVSVAVMGLSVLARHHLPFHYGAHAKDFIYEPLIRDFMVRNPLEAAASLLFHLGLPMLIVGAIAIRRGWTPRKDGR